MILLVCEQGRMKAQLSACHMYATHMPQPCQPAPGKCVLSSLLVLEPLSSLPTSMLQTDRL